MKATDWTIDGGTAKRLHSHVILTPDHVREIARALNVKPVRARKIGYVAARRAVRREAVETRWNGKETTNTAQRGDWIITSLSATKEPLRDRDGSLNIYVITADVFPGLYEPTDSRCEHGTIYRAKGIVDAIELPGGFDILAPWGERQQAPEGYLLFNGKDVYGNNAETFNATYVEIAAR